MSHRLEAIKGQEAWHMARGRRQPAAGLRHHAARGRQDACHAAQRLLDTPGIGGHGSRPGVGLDHAVAEQCCGSVTRAHGAS
jgi:hypothetical protein